MFVKNMINNIFFGKYGEVMRYLFFGVLNVIVTWGVYAIAVLAGIDPTISNIISWVIGVTFAFIVNKLYVFYSMTTEMTVVGKEAISFAIGRIITGAIALGGFPLLYSLGLNQSLFGVDGFYDKIIITVIETALNYFFSKYLVFNNSNTAETDSQYGSSN